jgi:hypothetical protein
VRWQGSSTIANAAQVAGAVARATQRGAILPVYPKDPAAIGNNGGAQDAFASFVATVGATFPDGVGRVPRDRPADVHRAGCGREHVLRRAPGAACELLRGRLAGGRRWSSGGGGRYLQVSAGENVTASGQIVFTYMKTAARKGKRTGRGRLFTVTRTMTQPFALAARGMSLSAKLKGPASGKLLATKATVTLVADTNPERTSTLTASG